MQGNELEKELAKWGSILDEEERENSLCLKNEAKDFFEAEVEIREQIKALTILPGQS